VLVFDSTPSSVKSLAPALDSPDLTIASGILTGVRPASSREFGFR
jgi:hypothetical protein